MSKKNNDNTPNDNNPEDDISKELSDLNLDDLDMEIKHDALKMPYVDKSESGRDNSDIDNNYDSLDEAATKIPRFGAMRKKHNLDYSSLEVEALARVLTQVVDCPVCRSQSDICPESHEHIMEAIYERVAELCSAAIGATNLRGHVRSMGGETVSTFDVGVEIIFSEIDTLRSILRKWRLAGN